MVNLPVCPEFNESRWNCYSDIKITANGFGVTVGFTVLKNSLDHLKGLSAKHKRRGILTCLRHIQCLASYISTEEEMPRVQCNRSNVPADTPLLYYERSTGIPFIDILLQQLQNRFSADNYWLVSSLLSLIPSLMLKLGKPPPPPDLVDFLGWG